VVKMRLKSPHCSLIHNKLSKIPEDVPIRGRMGGVDVTPYNPVYTRRVDPSVLAISLSLHRHPFVCILCISRFTCYNKSNKHSGVPTVRTPNVGSKKRGFVPKDNGETRNVKVINNREIELRNFELRPNYCYKNWKIELRPK